MKERTASRSLAVLPILALFLVGCATSRPPEDGDRQRAVWEAETREEVEALKRAMEAAYERERSVAERLRQAEEINRELRQEVESLNARSAANQAHLDSLQSGPPALVEIPLVRARAELDVADAYRAAWEQYRNHQYQVALDQFVEILSAAPYSEWADNAQYWKGECYFGMGKYLQALTEFTKVFAFQKTEKADDAQLKIGNCYLALGEKDKALAAFQKLLDEYPESEYGDRARKEMQALQAP